MSKKIVVLNGSPRANGNTAELVKVFTEGAERKGNTVTCFNLQRMDIHPCLGCCSGGKNFNSPCAQKDDMDKIYPAFREADIIVLASPLYYWTISGQLKVAIDRLFAIAECNEDFSYPQKECALLMAAEGDGFEEIVYWYERLMGHLGWTDKGKVLCSNVLNVGDIKGNPKLDEARKLGERI